MLIAAEVIWILTLLLILAITPVVLVFCYRLVQGALGIHHHFERSLEAAVGVIDNTAHVKALEATIGVAGGMLETAGRLDQHSGAIEGLLVGRLKGGK